MRAFLDANIYISYLLTPHGDTAPVFAVEAALTGAYTLLVAEDVITEIRVKAATKPYRSARITSTQTNRLVELLSGVAEALPELDEPLPEVGPDHRDDYLYAHAVIGRADYLVSGDRDVLAVERVGSVRIVSPAMFASILRNAGHI